MVNLCFVAIGLVVMIGWAALTIAVEVNDFEPA